jgi:hypothetical protein
MVRNTANSRYFVNVLMRGRARGKVRLLHRLVISGDEQQRI